MTLCGKNFKAEIQVAERSRVPFFADIQPQSFIEPNELKFRTSQNIERLGTSIQIIRGTSVINAKVLIAPLTRISTPRTLQLIRTASFPTDCGILGGDLFLNIPNNKYYLFLIETRIETGNDNAAIEGMISWCNHVAVHSRLINRPTGVGGVKGEFSMLRDDIRVSIEFISSTLREKEPGIFRDSSHRCYVPANIGVQPLDRLNIVGEDFRVDDIDPVTYPGISYCMLSRETRR